MEIYALKEYVSYGVYVHIVRANNLKRAKEITTKNLQPNGEIVKTKLLNFKGKTERTLFKGGYNE